jgi:hypothetical protein
MPSTTQIVKILPSEYTSSDGSKKMMYLQNRDEDVAITSSNQDLPSGSDTMKDIVDNLEDTAFKPSSGFVDTSNAQTVTGVKSFTNGIKIGNFSVTESVDPETNDPIFDISYVAPTPPSVE